MKSIELFPSNPVVQRIGSLQQVRVVANYADGSKRDITSEAFVSSGNGDIVKADRHGLVTTFRRGEAPILARFEGAYASTIVTVMGDRSPVLSGMNLQFTTRSINLLPPSGNV